MEVEGATNALTCNASNARNCDSTIAITVIVF
jgi:hypothetical protein